VSGFWFAGYGIAVSILYLSDVSRRSLLEYWLSAVSCRIEASVILTVLLRSGMLSRFSLVLADATR